MMYKSISLLFLALPILQQGCSNADTLSVGTKSAGESDPPADNPAVNPTPVNNDPANNDPANNDPANNDPANNDPANNTPPAYQVNSFEVTVTTSQPCNDAETEMQSALPDGYTVDFGCGSSRLRRLTGQTKFTAKITVADNVKLNKDEMLQLVDQFTDTNLQVELASVEMVIAENECTEATTLTMQQGGADVGLPCKNGCAGGTVSWAAGLEVAYCTSVVSDTDNNEEPENENNQSETTTVKPQADTSETTTVKPQTDTSETTTNEPVVQCVDGSATFDYVPNGDNVHPMRNNDYDCDYLTTCNADGSVDRSTCWIDDGCKVNGFIVNPVTWDWRMTVQNNTDFRQAMVTRCQNHGFQNAQVLDVTVENDLYTSYCTQTLDFADWMVRQCVPDWTVMDYITKDNFDAVKRNPEMYQWLDSFCLSQRGMTVNPETQTVQSDDILEFLHAQCTPKQYQTWTVEIKAQDYLLKIHFDSHNYKAVYNIEGVKERFCRDGYKMVAPEDNMWWNINDFFKNAKNLEELHMALCELDMNMDSFFD